MALKNFITDFCTTLGGDNTYGADCTVALKAAFESTDDVFFPDGTYRILTAPSFINATGKKYGNPPTDQVRGNNGELSSATFSCIVKIDNRTGNWESSNHFNSHFTFLTSVQNFEVTGIHFLIDWPTDAYTSKYYRFMGGVGPYKFGWWMYDAIQYNINIHHCKFEHGDSQGSVISNGFTYLNNSLKKVDNLKINDNIFLANNAIACFDFSTTTPYDKYTKSILDVEIKRNTFIAQGNGIDQWTLVTVSTDPTSIFTSVEHCLRDDVQNQFSFMNTGGALPDGLVTGTNYYTKKLTNDTFIVLKLGPSGYYPITETDGTPGIINWIAHGLIEDQAVYFYANTNTLPTQITSDTAYYVKTVLTADTFTISATVGGAALDFSGGSGPSIKAIPSVHCSTTGTGLHYWRLYQISWYGMAVTAPSVSHYSGFNVSDNYIEGFAYTGIELLSGAKSIGTDIGGVVIDNNYITNNGQTAFSIGTPMVVQTFTGSKLPTQIVNGTVYYVNSIPTADTFTISATVGGANINTTGGTATAYVKYSTDSAMLEDDRVYCNISNASPGIVTKVSHGLSVNTPIVFTPFYGYMRGMTITNNVMLNNKLPWTLLNVGDSLISNNICTLSGTVYRALTASHWENVKFINNIINSSTAAYNASIRALSFTLESSNQLIDNTFNLSNFIDLYLYGNNNVISNNTIDHTSYSGNITYSLYTYNKLGIGKMNNYVKNTVYLSASSSAVKPVWENIASSDNTLEPRGTIDQSIVYVDGILQSAFGTSFAYSSALTDFSRNNIHIRSSITLTGSPISAWECRLPGRFGVYTITNSSGQACTISCYNGVRTAVIPAGETKTVIIDSSFNCDLYIANKVRNFNGMVLNT